MILTVDLAWKSSNNQEFLTVAVANIQSVSICLLTFLLNSPALQLVLIFINTEYMYLRLHNQ